MVITSLSGLQYLNGIEIHRKEVLKSLNSEEETAQDSSVPQNTSSNN